LHKDTDLAVAVAMMVLVVPVVLLMEHQQLLQQPMGPQTLAMAVVVVPQVLTLQALTVAVASSSSATQIALQPPQQQEAPR
jgi:hypothetical protein